MANGYEGLRVQSQCRGRGARPRFDEKSFPFSWSAVWRILSCAWPIAIAWIFSSTSTARCRSPVRTAFAATMASLATLLQSSRVKPCVPGSTSAFSSEISRSSPILAEPRSLSIPGGVTTLRQRLRDLAGTLPLRVQSLQGGRSLTRRFQARRMRSLAPAFDDGKRFANRSGGAAFAQPSCREDSAT